MTPMQTDPSGVQEILRLNQRLAEVERERDTLEWAVRQKDAQLGEFAKHFEGLEPERDSALLAVKQMREALEHIKMLAEPVVTIFDRSIVEIVDKALSASPSLAEHDHGIRIAAMLEFADKAELRCYDSYDCDADYLGQAVSLVAIKEILTEMQSAGQRREEQP